MNKPETDDADSIQESDDYSILIRQIPDGFRFIERRHRWFGAATSPEKVWKAMIGTPDGDAAI